MDIVSDTWLGAILDRPVFRVDVQGDDVSSEPAVASVSQAVVRHVAGQFAAMYYAKADTASVNSARALMGAGFYVVDTALTFGWEAARRAARGADTATAACTVAEIEAEQEEAVLEIARTSFRFSRFHLDPFVSRHKADEIKRNWILSYLRGQRGDRLFVASSNGRPAGFLAAMRTTEAGRDTAVIDLIGVSPEFQRRGVGRALVDAFIAHYNATGARLLVGTQAANVPSIRLYEQSGFSLVSSRYVFHMHAPCAAIASAGAAGR